MIVVATNMVAVGYGPGMVFGELLCRQRFPCFSMYPYRAVLRNPNYFYGSDSVSYFWQDTVPILVLIFNELLFRFRFRI